MNRYENDHHFPQPLGIPIYIYKIGEMADTSVDMIDNLLGISPPKGRRVPENQTTQEKELDSAWTTKMKTTNWSVLL